MKLLPPQRSRSLRKRGHPYVMDGSMDQSVRESVSELVSESVSERCMYVTPIRSDLL